MSKELQEAKADSLWRQGDLAGAASILTMLAETHPADHDLWVRLGYLHAVSGKVASSVDCYNKALVIAPDSEHAHFGIAMVYGLSGAQGKARDHFSIVVSLNPDNVDANVKLGILEFYRGNTPQSLRLLAKAESINPNHMELNVRLAEVFWAVREPEKAVAHLEKANRIQPNNPEVVHRLASQKVDLGEYESAYELIRPFIECARPFIGAAVLLSDFCHLTGRCPEALNALLRILTPDTMGDDKMSICFAIGKLLDRKKEYRAAFKYFKCANDIYSKTFDYMAEQAWLTSIKARFDRDYFTTAPTAGYIPGIQPVFIVGMPRSGTSLIEQILSSHPQVNGAGERSEFIQAATTLDLMLGTGLQFAGPTGRVSQSVLDRLAGEYVDKVGAGVDDSILYFTDKMPHNYRRLGYIQLLFPQARVIHCRRGALDTCLSNYFTLFGRAHEYSYRLESLAQKYLAYVDVMRHWKNSLDLDVLDIRYEDLVTSPGQEIRKILEFCRLDWSDDCLNFHKNRRRVFTASRSQVRQPLYSGSVNRWRNYEQEIVELRNLLAPHLESDSL